MGAQVTTIWWCCRPASPTHPSAAPNGNNMFTDLDSPDRCHSGIRPPPPLLAVNNCGNEAGSNQLPGGVPAGPHRYVDGAQHEDSLAGKAAGADSLLRSSGARANQPSSTLSATSSPPPLTAFPRLKANGVAVQNTSGGGPSSGRIVREQELQNQPQQQQGMNARGSSGSATLNQSREYQSAFNDEASQNSPPRPHEQSSWPGAGGAADRAATRGGVDPRSSGPQQHQPSFLSTPPQAAVFSEKLIFASTAQMRNVQSLIDYHAGGQSSKTNPSSAGKRRSGDGGSTAAESVAGDAQESGNGSLMPSTVSTTLRWRLLYSSNVHGFSFAALRQRYRRMESQQRRASGAGLGAATAAPTAVDSFAADAADAAGAKKKRAVSSTAADGGSQVTGDAVNPDVPTVLLIETDSVVWMREAERQEEGAGAGGGNSAQSRRSRQEMRSSTSTRRPGDAQGDGGQGEDATAPPSSDAADETGGEEALKPYHVCIGLYLNRAPNLLGNQFYSSKEAFLFSFCVPIRDSVTTAHLVAAEGASIMSPHFPQRVDTARPNREAASDAGAEDALSAPSGSLTPSAQPLPPSMVLGGVEGEQDSRDSLNEMGAMPTGAASSSWTAMQRAPRQRLWQRRATQPSQSQVLSTVVSPAATPSEGHAWGDPLYSPCSAGDAETPSEGLAVGNGEDRSLAAEDASRRTNCSPVFNNNNNNNSSSGSQQQQQHHHHHHISGSSGLPHESGGGCQGDGTYCIECDTVTQERLYVNNSEASYSRIDIHESMGGGRISPHGRSHILRGGGGGGDHRPAKGSGGANSHSNAMAYSFTSVSDTTATCLTALPRHRNSIAADRGGGAGADLGSWTHDALPMYSTDLDRSDLGGTFSRLNLDNYSHSTAPTAHPNHHHSTHRRVITDVSMYSVTLVSVSSFGEDDFIDNMGVWNDVSGRGEEEEEEEEEDGEAERGDEARRGRLRTSHSDSHSSSSSASSRLCAAAGGVRRRRSSVSAKLGAASSAARKALAGVAAAASGSSQRRPGAPKTDLDASGDAGSGSGGRGRRRARSPSPSSSSYSTSSSSSASSRASSLSVLSAGAQRRHSRGGVTQPRGASRGALSQEEAQRQQQAKVEQRSHASDQTGASGDTTNAPSSSKHSAGGGGGVGGGRGGAAPVMRRRRLTFTRRELLRINPLFKHKQRKRPSRRRRNRLSVLVSEEGTLLVWVGDIDKQPALILTQDFRLIHCHTQLPLVGSKKQIRRYAKYCGAFHAAAVATAAMADAAAADSVFSDAGDDGGADAGCGGGGAFACGEGGENVHEFCGGGQEGACYGCTTPLYREFGDPLGHLPTRDDGCRNGGGTSSQLSRQTSSIVSPARASSTGAAEFNHRVPELVNGDNEDEKGPMIVDVGREISLMSCETAVHPDSASEVASALCNREVDVRGDGGSTARNSVGSPLSGQRGAASANGGLCNESVTSASTRTKGRSDGGKPSLTKRLGSGLRALTGLRSTQSHGSGNNKDGRSTVRDGASCASGNGPASVTGRASNNGAANSNNNNRESVYGTRSHKGKKFDFNAEVVRIQVCAVGAP